MGERFASVKQGFPALGRMRLRSQIRKLRNRDAAVTVSGLFRI
jgi:hypothetical protein